MNVLGLSNRISVVVHGPITLVGFLVFGLMPDVIGASSTTVAVGMITAAIVTITFGALSIRCFNDDETLWPVATAAVVTLLGILLMLF